MRANPSGATRTVKSTREVAPRHIARVTERRCLDKSFSGLFGGVAQQHSWWFAPGTVPSTFYKAPDVHRCARFGQSCSIPSSSPWCPVLQNVNT
jgi:hypothetical protein